MYIILVLGNNYIRGDKMKNRRIKSFFVPVIYGTLVLAFLFSMFFVGKFANNLLFSKKDNNISKYLYNYNLLVPYQEHHTDSYQHHDHIQ